MLNKKPYEVDIKKFLNSFHISELKHKKRAKFIGRELFQTKTIKASNRLQKRLNEFDFIASEMKRIDYIDLYRYYFKLYLESKKNV